MCTLLTFFLIVGAFSYKATSANCPSAYRQEPLDIEAMSGDWWIWAHSDGAWSDIEQKNMMSRWFVDHVIYTSFLPKYNQTLTIAADVLVNDKNSIDLIYHMPIMGTRTQTRNVLGGDFDNYLVTWSCDEEDIVAMKGTSTDNQKSEPMINMWVLTRERDPSWSVWPLVEKACRENNLTYPAMTRIDNSG